MAPSLVASLFATFEHIEHSEHYRITYLKKHENIKTRITTVDYCSVLLSMVRPNNFRQSSRTEAVHLQHALEESGPQPYQNRQMSNLPNRDLPKEVGLFGTKNRGIMGHQGYLYNHLWGYNLDIIWI